MSHALSLVAATVATIASGISPLTLVTAAAGSALVVVGLSRRSRGALALGGAVVFTASLLVAGRDAGALTVLTVAFGGVLAYDLGEFAVDLSATVGPDTATVRVELLHAVASGLVALVAGGLGLVVYRGVGGGQSLSVVALLFAAVVLASQLGPGTERPADGSDRSSEANAGHPE